MFKNPHVVIGSVSLLLILALISAFTLTQPTELTYDDYIEQADAALDAENYEEALELYDLASEIEPENKYPYIQQGTIYFVLEDYPDAVLHLTYALDVTEGDPEPYLIRARMFDEMEWHSDALDDYRRYLEFAAPNDPFREFARQRVGALWLELFAGND
ncbi:MAG: hypothetical protein GYB68_10540 [Chloroflexi bacterium]|nr:hypothetical protein [Chloroflexota bacterium]